MTDEQRKETEDMLISRFGEPENDVEELMAIYEDYQSNPEISEGWLLAAY